MKSWNRKELMAHGLLLGGVPWLVVLVALNWPGLRERAGLRYGSDFAHFYVLGETALARDARLLYDADAHHRRQLELEPRQRDWYLPVNPPSTALMAAPVASLPYPFALWLWRCLTIAVFAVVVWKTWRECRSLKTAGLLVAVVAAGFPPLRQQLLYGQRTLVPLLAFFGFWLALRARRDVLAGLALSLLSIKPQLGLVVGIWSLVERRWAVILGGLLGLGVQALALWAVFGSQALTAYPSVLSGVSGSAALLEPDPAQFHSIRGFLILLVPRAAVLPFWAILAGLVGWAAIRFWQTPVELDTRYAVLLMATCLVSPHFPGYEAVLLAPALLFVVNRAAAWSSRTLGPLVYALYVFLLFPTGALVPVQMSTLILTALFLTTIGTARSMANGPSAVRPLEAQ